MSRINTPSIVSRAIDFAKQNVINPIINKTNDFSVTYGNGKVRSYLPTIASQNADRYQQTVNARRILESGAYHNDARNNDYIYKGVTKDLTQTIPSPMKTIKGKISDFVSNFIKSPAKTQQNKRLIPTRIPTAAPTAIPTPTLMPKNPTWGELKQFFADKAKAGGYHQGAIVGQKANESARGTSNFAINRYNYGGVGAFDSNPNNAYTFESPEAYWDYYNLMIKKRFPEAYKNRSNGQQYLTELKKGNYASSPSYVADIMNTPEYREFDKIVAAILNNQHLTRAR